MKRYKLGWLLKSIGSALLFGPLILCGVVALTLIMLIIPLMVMLFSLSEGNLLGLIMFAPIVTFIGGAILVVGEVLTGDIFC